MRRSRALVLFLIIALLGPLFIAPAYAVTEAELREHQQAARDAYSAANAADAEASRLSAEVKALDSTIASIQGDINALVDDIDSATTRTRRLQAEVDDLTARIATKQAEIDVTQAEYEHQKELLAARIASSYKNGDLIYLELILESKNIEDLITRTTLVARVIKSNQDFAQMLEDTRVALEAAQASLQQDRAAVDEKRAEAAAEEKRLKQLRADHQSKLDSQKNAQDSKAALVAENKANAERLRALARAEEAESAAIAAELNGGGSGVFAGVMTFPVPGFEQVPTGGSAFGYRIHPILGYRRLHTGIDISGGAVGRSINGAPIVAAADGTVVYAGYRGGYGNCTIIDHGNGVTTLYAHQQTGSFRVSNGDRVTRGQAIGRVGSTGMSTGPHLHFEVRINGTPVDPMPYLR